MLSSPISRLTPVITGSVSSRLAAGATWPIAVASTPPSTEPASSGSSGSRGYSLTGKVTRVNQALVDAPEGVNDDPHEKGWMVEIEMSAPTEASELLSARQYEELLASEH